MSCITDKSAHGTPPLWQLDIRAPEGLDPGHAHISLAPELFAFSTNSPAIDELSVVLRTYLLAMAQELQSR